VESTLQNKPLTKDVLALIPARGGSKRIIGKNHKKLHGKPLIQYSIEHALKARKISDVVVSTDDAECKKIAGGLGVEILHRAEVLSRDTSTTLSVVQDAISQLESVGRSYRAVVLLQPTVPIRRDGSIDEAINLLFENDFDSVISHIKVDYFHPNKMKVIQDGLVLPYSEVELENTATSTLDSVYFRDGSIYATKTETISLKNSLFGDKVGALVNDNQYFVNIDSQRDWLVAEALLSWINRADDKL